MLSEELWGVGEDGGPPPTNPGETATLARPPRPRNTLWQELPAVQASGLLDTLSPQERRMQEVGMVEGGAGQGQHRGREQVVQVRGQQHAGLSGFLEPV